MICTFNLLQTHSANNHYPEYTGSNDNHTFSVDTERQKTNTRYHTARNTYISIHFNSCQQDTHSLSSFWSIPHSLLQHVSIIIHRIAKNKLPFHTKIYKIKTWNKITMNLRMIVLSWDKVQQKKSNLKVVNPSAALWQCWSRVIYGSHKQWHFWKRKYNIYTALTYTNLVEYDTFGNCIHFTYKQSKHTQQFVGMLH